jgi:hypothetical protein
MVKPAQPPTTATSEVAVISIFTPVALDEAVDRFGFRLDDIGNLLIKSESKIA